MPREGPPQSASLDADSEGVEGRFYVWSLAELTAELGALAPAAIAYFGASEQGNFDGTNVLEAHGPEPVEREQIRAALLGARARRVRPALDDKRLSAWNALMIAALADATAAWRVCRRTWRITRSCSRRC
ncbi:MAG TPA: hypothetical protein VFC30_00580 [Solirubrobacteraceae bacterium]|nr:hypothetical protein [Solirubrobacteraceae bacterium]